MIRPRHADEQHHSMCLCTSAWHGIQPVIICKSGPHRWTPAPPGCQCPAAAPAWRPCSRSAAWPAPACLQPGGSRTAAHVRDIKACMGLGHPADRMAAGHKQYRGIRRAPTWCKATGQHMPVRWLTVARRAGSSRSRPSTTNSRLCPSRPVMEEVTMPARQQWQASMQCADLGSRGLVADQHAGWHARRSRHAMLSA